MRNGVVFQLTHFSAQRRNTGSSSVFPKLSISFSSAAVRRQEARDILAKLRMAPTPPTDPIVIGGRRYRPVREGLASILAPFQERASPPPPGKQVRNNDEGDQAVFYNPIQQFNRDLSVLAILTYGEGAVIEKESRFARKQESTRRRKERLKKARDEIPKDPANALGGNDRKRKAERLSEDALESLNGNGIKKPRTNNLHVEDEELEVVQLNGNEPTEPTPTVDDTAMNDGEEKPPSEASQPKPKKIPFAILDALAATGLRALRYAKEIPLATNIIANDLSPEAVKSIELNIDHNEVSKVVHSNVGDARAFMYSKVGNEHQQPADGYVHRFDVIDLDPYGTAAPFLDSAVQALQDGGLLCVTCTDAGVFASNGYPEKAYALYGGIPVKGSHSHEGGLRLILHAIASAAAKYGIAIEPLLSLSIDFYARVFVRVHKQQKDVKLLAGTIMSVYTCDYGCGAWTTQLLARNQAMQARNGDTVFKNSFAQGPTTTPLCQHCGTKMHVGGPMWGGPLHNPYFIQRILDKLPTLDKAVYGTIDRLRGMLTVALEEDLTLAQSDTPEKQQGEEDGSNNHTTAAPTPSAALIPRVPPSTIDSTPFFFIPNYLAKILHCTTPPEDPLRGAIRHLGYRVTRSHCKPGSFKTNAPWAVLWEIMREWMRTKAPIKEGAVKPNSPGWKILAAMRHTERRRVLDVKEELSSKMEKCESEEDLKTVVRSVLWKLEHEKPPSSTATTATTTIVDSNEAAASAPPVIETTDPISSRITTTTAAAAASALEVSKVQNLNIVFDERLGREKPREKLLRYQINPRANWGPMNRAGGGGGAGP